MLPKKNRLSDTNQIDALKKNSKRLHSKYLTILLSENNSDTPLFAFIVSKKVSKKAVDRNKIKRILRDEVFKNINRFTNNKYLIIAKQNTAAANTSDLREDLKNLIKKLK